MVTLLDFSGILEYFLPAFLFLLVYALIFGVLQKTKLFGEDTKLNWVVALVISVLFVLTPGAMDFIEYIAPWFIVIALVIFSLLLIFLFFGVSTEKISGLAENTTVQWFIFIIAGIIIITGLAKVVGPVFSPSGNGGVGEEVRKTIFSTKVLATILILLIASMAIRFLSETSLIKK